MHVQLDAAGSNSLLSIMRQVTALVRRRGKFETCGEHHFCVGSPTGRRRFPQKEDSAGSNPSRRTNAHVDQRQESPPSKRGQCWFESNHGHQIRGRSGIGIRAGLKPRSLQFRSLSPAPTQKEDRHVDHAHAGSARNRSDQMRSRAFRRHQAHRHMWRRLKEDRNQHYENLQCPCLFDPKAMARFKEQPQKCSRECCGNQRHTWGRDNPTMQERRFLCTPIA